MLCYHYLCAAGISISTYHWDKEYMPPLRVVAGTHLTRGGRDGWCHVEVDVPRLVSQVLYTVRHA